MEISYTIVQNKDPNTFVTVPLQINACCYDSLRWLIGKVCDVAISDSTILVQNDPTKVADYYKHCQFCGKRHVCTEFEEDVDDVTGEKRYIPKQQKKVIKKENESRKDAKVE